MHELLAMTVFRSVKLWGFLYIFSIFAFAFVYNLLDRAFFQSTAEFERQAVFFDQLRSTELFLAMSGTCRGFGPKCDLIVGSPTRLSDTVFIIPLRQIYDGGRAVEEIEVSGKLEFGHGPNNHNHIRFNVLANDSVTSNIIGLLEKKLELNNKIQRSYRSDRSELTTYSDFRFGVQNDELFSSALAWLDLSSARILVRSSYLRMLYFSAVTATTLGYGDIVPLTQTARLIVTIQTILGLVLVGLFLNALALRSSQT